MEEFNQFQINVKKSFEIAKEHNLRLEAEIKAIKEKLSTIRLILNPLINKEKLNNSPQEIMGSPTTNSQQPTTTANNTSPTTTLTNLKNDVNSIFLSLTDRELSVFMALYSLETEERREIDYFELSQRLKLSESTIRDFVNALIRKGMPIDKIRIHNGKVSLSIKNEFKSLELYQKLLKLRPSKQSQKTLFEV